MVFLFGCLATAIPRSPSLIHRQVPRFPKPADLQHELSQDLSVQTNIPHLTGGIC